MIVIKDDDDDGDDYTNLYNGTSMQDKCNEQLRKEVLKHVNFSLKLYYNEEVN